MYSKGRKNQPLVSIILPVFNQVKFLERAVSSIFCQSYKHWELIIIDNYSTDGTWKYIESLQHVNTIRKLQFSNNGIVGASRNHGVDCADGELLAMIDSDDFWFSNKLMIAVDAHNSGADIVYHDLELIFDRAPKFKWSRSVGAYRLNSRPFLKMISCGNPVPNSSATVRTDLFRKLNGFDTGMECVGWEDYDLWLRLAENGASFFMIKKCLGAYSINCTNLTSPRRTISNVNEFIERYNPHFDSSVPTWCSYSLARSYYQLRAHELSYKNLQSCVLFNCNFKLSLKILAMWVLLIIKKVGVKT